MTRPLLTDEESDVADLVAAVVAGRRPSDERPDELAAMRRRLDDAGLWVVDGPDDLVAVVLARLGRDWPALAWASVQARVAADVLGEDALPGGTAVAVVDADSPTVRLTEANGLVTGVVDRLDAAGERPHVVVLGHGSARVVPPTAMRFSRLRRTGLDGALTSSAELVAPTAVAEVDGVDTDAARVRLRLGGAAVAAGLADAATGAALTYSSRRVQFGGPLIALPTVRDGLFGAARGALTAWRQVFRAATPWQAAAVLDQACEHALDACAHAVQAHGGYGYLVEYGVERLLRDAVSLRAACDVSTARRTGAASLTGWEAP